MSRLMDRVMPNIDPLDDDAQERVRAELQRIAPTCAWTDGVWVDLGGIPWNQLQNTARDIKVLSNLLVRSYVQSRAAR
jgi:hypothetical protein